MSTHMDENREMKEMKDREKTGVTFFSEKDRQSLSREIQKALRAKKRAVTSGRR